MQNLYDAALGLYNFDLALMIAKHSQMDPKEYLHMFQCLMQYEPDYQKFKIDDSLKRHDKALGHLYRSGKLDEFMAYTLQHELYADALTICRESAEQRAKVLCAFAQHMYNKKEYEQAAYYFEQAREYNGAREAFKLAGLWKEAFLMHRLSGTSSADLPIFAKNMASILIDKQDYLGAASVYTDYVNVRRGVPDIFGY